MKKTTWIAIGIFVALAGVFFILRDKPAQQVEAPMVIEKVDGLSRVEIVPAKGEEQPDLIVLEKQDGQWWLTKPVESPMAERAARALEEAFADDIRTDDLELSPERAAKYELDEDSAVRVSAYGLDGTKPAVELEVGKQISVAQTGVERTYIKKPGSDELYRAQVGLGRLVRRPVSELRSKQIAWLDKQKIDAIEISYHEGPTVRVARADGDWKIAEPKVDGELEQARLDRVINTLARLRATGFVDDAKLAELGLEPAKATLTAEVGGATREILIGWSGAEDERTYFAKLAGEPQVYEIASYTADNLLVELEELEKAGEEEVAEE